VETRLRKVVLEQRDLRDQVGSLINNDADPSVMTPEQRERTMGVTDGQLRLARQLRDVALQLDELRDRMDENHAGDEESRGRVPAIAARVRGVAAGPVTSAAGATGAARDRTDASDQRDDLMRANELQDEAIDDLQSVLRSLLQWGSFESLVNRTRELLDRQTSVSAKTRELGRSTLGKRLDGLTEEEAVALRRTLREQQQLASDVERHLSNMERLRDADSGKSSAASDAMDTALRAARAHEVKEHLASAASAIESNRTAAATIHQRSAADGMRKMISALRERETRELEELRKRAERAEDEVSRLIAIQEELRAATQEAALMDADKALVTELAEGQRRLGRNTDLLGAELADVERAVVAARLLRKAAAPMRRAESQLQTPTFDAVDAAQSEALELLSDALTSLEELARATAEEQLRRSLGRIYDELEAMLASQTAVNNGIVELQGAIAKRGRLGRSESRRASGLAREQSAVSAMVDEMLPELEKVPVYKWALERVSEWMSSSSEALDDRRIDDALIASTDRIASELQKLLNALLETQSLPTSTEFVEAEGGGGGGASRGGSVKPIPTVAELLVLKAMQVDINDRTRTINDSFEVAEATEKQLRRLATIGEDQAEVRRLAELVTERSKQ
jgi:hypothetical protein